METNHQQNHFNNPVVIILFIALVGLGGYFLFSRNQNDSQVMPNTDQEQIDNLKKEVDALKNLQPQGQQVVKSKPNLSSIIKQWSPSVALIVCNFSNGDSDFGSGFLFLDSDGSIKVETNAHVITDKAGYAASNCAIKIPGDDKIYTEDSSTFMVHDSEDSGYITVTDGDTYFNSVPQKRINQGGTICHEQEKTGDSVVILGYPDYAGQFTNPTATQGIISGYSAPYYTTSAQIESGNSGGVALDPDKNCYIGIPSAVKIGNYANLGRILNANVLIKLPY